MTYRLKFAVWAVLEAEGWGVSLQHYNPLIDEAVRETWKLVAQMPFGKPAAPPSDKEFQAIDERGSIYN